MLPARDAVALLDLILGYDCNLACDYCTITPEMRRRALSSAEVVAAMRRGRELGYDRVQLTGGEPTIRADLIPLVRAARQLGFGDIKVQTNGLLFAERRNLERALVAGVTRIHVSIHTHAAARYDAKVRRDDSYRLMVAAIEQCVDSGVAFAADVILDESTYRDLPAAVQWLYERGVRQADLWFVSLTDGNRDNLASMPRMTEVMPYVEQACAWARERDLVVRSLHIPRCLLGTAVGHAFDPASERVMVVTPDASFELADSKLTPQQHVPACDGCEHRPICPGVRRDYVERYGDGEIARARGQQAQIAPVRALSTVE